MTYSNIDMPVITHPNHLVDLLRCREQTRIISFSQEIDPIDPLAVLGEFACKNGHHFYWENPSQEEAIVAFGCARHYTIESPQRFKQCQNFIQDCLNQTLSIGDLHQPGAGPHLFCSFSFFDEQDITVLGIVLFCCALGYTYQGPPFRFGYLGLGEIICFICFGPAAISAAYYAQTQSFSLVIIPAGVIIGITTSIILFCSHFHQVEDDIAAGKRSPVVRLGTQRGSVVLTWVTASVFALTTLFVFTGVFGLWSLLIWSSFPVALKLINHVKEYHNQPDRVKNCKFIAVNFHFLSGLLLALGFVLSTRL